MNAHLWLGFVLASLVMGLIPGPGVMSIIGYAVGSGRKTALASVAGVGALLAAFSSRRGSLLRWRAGNSVSHATGK